MKRVFALFVSVMGVPAWAGLCLAADSPLGEPLNYGAVASEQIAEPETTGETDESAETLLVNAPAPAAAAVSGSTPPAAKKPAPKKPAGSPYKGMFYDNDFQQLAQPQYLGHELKRLHPCDCWTVDLGGEYRARYQNESNLRGSNFSNTSDEFVLGRTRLYANAEYSNVFRLYAEAIDATSNYEDFPPRTIEENRFDALNLFGDALLLDTGEGKWKGRVGRQELLYGEQRLVSPLDWANTRRTFDGAKIFYQSKDWNLDGFWTRPVPFAQHVNNDSNFDENDSSQEFVGLYSTYKGTPDQVYDFYFLRFAEYQGPGTIFAPVDADPMLFGTRGFGKDKDYFCDGALYWDYEGGYQFGNWGGLTQNAGFATIGLGRDWAKAKYKPKLMLYYDYASGDHDPNDGQHQTFFQYFPLGHKYFGFADLVARQNIHDVNGQLYFYLDKKTTFLIWQHFFWLDSSRDALYNAAGVPILYNPAGSSGTNVGAELDLTLQYNINPYSDLLVGYSHFFPGSFVNSFRPYGNEIDFTYVQYTIRF